MAAHYATTGPQIWQQICGEIDVFVASASTGGTLSGTGRYLKEKSPKIRIILADPKGSIYFKYLKEGVVDKSEIHPYQVEGVGEDHVAKCLDTTVIDDVIQFTDDNAFSTVRELARQEGFLCGGSSGANIWTAMHVAKQMKNATIVTVLPDSGVKYLSKIFP
jgi:cystathionine beta-synthase/cysteine synthase A